MKYEFQRIVEEIKATHYFFPSLWNCILVARLKISEVLRTLHVPPAYGPIRPLPSAPKKCGIVDPAQRGKKSLTFPWATKRCRSCVIPAASPLHGISLLTGSGNCRVQFVQWCASSQRRLKFLGIAPHFIILMMQLHHCCLL